MPEPFEMRRQHQHRRTRVQIVPARRSRHSPDVRRARPAAARAIARSHGAAASVAPPASHSGGASGVAARAAPHRRRAARRRSCAARACRRTGSARAAQAPAAASRPARPASRRRCGPRDAEPPFDLAGGELRDRDDGRGAPRVRRRERRDSRGGSRRACARDGQEVQVVDGDDLRGAPRRHQQRMQRMRRRRCGPASVSTGGQPSRCHAEVEQP